MRNDSLFCRVGPQSCFNPHSVRIGTFLLFKITFFSDVFLLGFFLHLLISLFSTSSRQSHHTIHLHQSVYRSQTLLGLPHQVQSLNSYRFFKWVIAFSFTLSFLLVWLSISFWSTTSEVCVGFFESCKLQFRQWFTGPSCLNLLKLCLWTYNSLFIMGKVTYLAPVTMCSDIKHRIFLL